jgi:hypothetical protein
MSSEMIAAFYFLLSFFLTGDGRRETGDGRRKTGDGRRMRAESADRSVGIQIPPAPLFLEPRVKSQESRLLGSGY